MDDDYFDEWAALEDLEDLEFADEALYLDDDRDAYEDVVDLGDAFRDVLHEDYAALSPEETDQALLDVFDSLTPAESFSFAKALGQVQKGTMDTLTNPAFQQLALPVVGTALGGPVGGTLAGAAGKALAGSPATSPAASATAPPIAGATRPPGTAAKRALVASYLPVVQQALLAGALREHGRKTVSGVPVNEVMKMFSALLGQAAAEADELSEAGEEESAYLLDDHEALYDSLIGAEDEDLSDVAGMF
ncbi:MAG: hypothetical protein ACRDZS_00480 [Acidimicrobiales bacterium]